MLSLRYGAAIRVFCTAFLCLPAFLLLISPLPAMAHVTLADPSAPAGSYAVSTFRVGHGCAGSPTTALRIEIPDSVLSVRPQPKPGWTLHMEQTALPKPVAGEGGQMQSTRVSAIIWQGGTLPADQFDEFALMMKLPGAAGTLVFPVTQTCAKGVEHWSDLPMAGMTMAHPAPVLTLTPAAPPPMGGMRGM